MTTSNPVKNKIILDICQEKISVIDFEFYAGIIYEWFFSKKYDLEIKIPREGFKITGDLSLMSEAAKSVYKYLVKRQAVNNIYLIKSTG